MQHETHTRTHTYTRVYTYTYYTLTLTFTRARTHTHTHAQARMCMHKTHNIHTHKHIHALEATILQVVFNEERVGVRSEQGRAPLNVCGFKFDESLEVQQTLNELRTTVFRFVRMRKSSQTQIMLHSTVQCTESHRSPESQA